jgi:hypothetical protein
MRRRSFGPPNAPSSADTGDHPLLRHDGYGRGSRVVERPRKLPIAAAIDAALRDRRGGGGKFFLACWPLDRVICYTVDADKHPVAATTVLGGPVTSSTTNSGGTRHLNGTPLVPMPLVT